MAGIAASRAAGASCSGSSARAAAPATVDSACTGLHPGPATRANGPRAAA